MAKSSNQIKYAQPIIIGILILSITIVANYQFAGYQSQLINQNKANMKKIIEDTISMKEDQLNQMATSLNQFYSETQKDERMDFNHYVKILIQQRPEIRNIFILENNQIIQSYPHTEFVGLDFSTLYSSYPIQIDGIKVMNPEFPLKTQNNQKIIISVPFDFCFALSEPSRILARVSSE